MFWCFSKWPNRKAAPYGAAFLLGFAWNRKFFRFSESGIAGEGAELRLHVGGETCKVFLCSRRVTGQSVQIRICKMFALISSIVEAGLLQVIGGGLQFVKGGNFPLGEGTPYVGR